jgi:hypothetical protein
VRGRTRIAENITSFYDILEARLLLVDINGFNCIFFQVETRQIVSVSGRKIFNPLWPFGLKVIIIYVDWQSHEKKR